jgi:hypothetical protein
VEARKASLLQTSAEEPIAPEQASPPVPTSMPTPTPTQAPALLPAPPLPSTLEVLGGANLAPVPGAVKPARR